MNIHDSAFINHPAAGLDPSTENPHINGGCPFSIGGYPQDPHVISRFSMAKSNSEAQRAPVLLAELAEARPLRGCLFVLLREDVLRPGIGMGGYMHL